MSGKKKITTGSTAVDRSSINILVVGDDGVGKSSLISTFVSRLFVDTVPGVMTKVRLPPDPTILNGNIITTIIDSQGADSRLISAATAMTGSVTFGSVHPDITNAFPSQASLDIDALLANTSASVNHGIMIGGDADAVQSTFTHTPDTAVNKNVNFGGGVEHVDSIVLVYDLDRIETFYRLENHWLPLIERCYRGEMPVVIAGNKMDVFRQTSFSSSSGSELERSLISSHRQIVALLQRFKFIRQVTKCSAKHLLNVDEVFVKAQHAVLYPFVPLFDLDRGRISNRCKQVFNRIFRMYDCDHDGLLSMTELNAFQMFAFQVPLTEREFTGWKKVVVKNYEQEYNGGVGLEPVIEDGKFTMAGFLAIFDVFISQNRLDVPWKILRKFGYDDDLNLDLSHNLNRVTYMPRSLDKKVTQGSCGLTRSAQQFLTRLFHQFDSDHDGVLSREDLMKIFSILPERLPPWHSSRIKGISDGSFSVPRFDRISSGSVSSSSCGSGPSLSASGITVCSVGSLSSVESGSNDCVLLHSSAFRPFSFSDWMGHWFVLASISESSTCDELFRLGHVEDRSTIGLNNIDESRRKTESLGSKDHKDKSASLPFVATRVFVITKGSTVGSELIGYLRGSFLDRVPPSTIADDELTEKNIIPLSHEAETSFVVHTRPPVQRGCEKREKADYDESYIIFTDVFDTEGVANLKEMMCNTPMKSCDLVVLAFSCHDVDSFNFVQKFEKEMLEDNVARIYVGLESVAPRDSENMTVALGTKAALEHCKALELDDPLILSRDTQTDDKRQTVLEYLISCAQVNTIVRVTPHGESKKQEAAKRRKMLWIVFGGISFAASLGIGIFITTGSTSSSTDRERRSKESVTRFSWVHRLFTYGLRSGFMFN